MQTSEKEMKPQKVLCSNCGAIVLKREEYCGECAPIRNVLASAAMEKAEAEKKARESEEIIQLAVTRLNEQKDHQKRVIGKAVKIN